MPETQVKRPGNVQTASIQRLAFAHPESGRKALYIGGHVQSFVGMTNEESIPLMDFFMKRSTRSEFTCRVRWANGRMAIRADRRTRRFAANEYLDERRIMHRIAVCGDRPV